MADFIILEPSPGEHGAYFGSVINFSQAGRFRHGVPLASSFPSGVAFRMDPAFPNGTFLHDVTNVEATALVGSRRLRNAFEEYGVTRIEYLPVALLNHKGRSTNAEYFVFNTLENIDCLDRKASSPEYDPAEPDHPVWGIDSVERVVLEPSLIPPERAVFRVEQFTTFHVFRRDFARWLDARELSGFEWIQLQDFTG